MQEIKRKNVEDEKQIVQASNKRTDEQEDNKRTDSNDPMNQSIETLANLHIHMEKKVGPHQRAVEGMTAFLGRPRSLYIIGLLVILWIGVNLIAQETGHKTIDPAPFYWLQGSIGLSALLMTTIVLITQNRQNKTQEQRRQLDLQVNLLVEQKVTKVISLLEELRRDLPEVRDRHDEEVEAMKQTVDPHEVLATFQQMVSEADQE